MKDVGIRIRVEQELRSAFAAACRAEDRQVSDVLREFMQTYATQHQNGRQRSLFAAATKEQRSGRAKNA